MTNEEAINILNDYDINFERNTAEEVAEAHEMAIEALKTQPRPMENFESVKDHIYKLAGDYKCWDNRLTNDEALELCHILEKQPCNDCISRDATLTAFSDYVGDGMSMNDFDAMWDIVVKMPPVEPKPKTSEDCISRKAVLEGLHRYFAEGFNEDRWWNSTYVLGAINEVPSIAPQPKEEPQQKTGHWEWVQYESKPNFGNWHCSECRHILCGAIKGNPVKLPNYCEECGSYNGGTKQ